ncbi:MAG: hypothetical protein JG761_352 [Proteiniphilum sp.]|nr:hypothetical protein [Proteiniphilum sp.]
MLYIVAHILTRKMSKEKFHIEFLMGNATQNSLWRMISQIDGLSEWFADEVRMDETETRYTFLWGKSSNEAEIISSKPQSLIRYHWLDDEDLNVYFEFILRKLDLSGEMTLEITDFAEPDEKGDAITLWETQVDLLKRRLGV